MSRRGRAALLARAGVFALALPLAAASLGCGAGLGVCTSVCSRQYSDCVARSAPGASQSDCAAREQQCSAECRAKR